MVHGVCVGKGEGEDGLLSASVVNLGHQVQTQRE